MVTPSDKLAMIGPSLADLVLEIFCFAASPSFRGVATLVSKARQAVKDAGSSSPELAKDHSDLGKHITDVLTIKVKEARQQRLDLGVDVSLLTQAETAVAALISTDAERDLVVLSAVRDPAGFENYLRTRAAKYRQQIEEQAEPYFDALVRAVAAAYVEIAPWSDTFVVIALKSLLGECTDIKEQLNASQIENRQLFSQILQVVESLLKAIEELNKPSDTERVCFGSRPNVVKDRFCEREEQKQLDPVLDDDTPERTVLVGMRGCGKTQLAAALAKECEDANWSLIAWTNAVSRESIQSDLVELAKQLGIGTSDLPTQDEVIHRCLNHLQSVGPADRLIVFDNVEDINHLTGLIPSGDGVRVVATTTNKVGWEDQGWNSIKVGVFDRNTSIEYLLTVTNSDDRDAADTLAERLGDLPLAIAQAAATARHKDLSLARYLKRLESRGEELLIRPIPGDEYTDDVATVLWMATEAAVDSMKNGTKEMARRQLGALALLAESGVPTRWLDPTIEQQDDWELQGTNPAEDEDAHDALTELIHRSIVQQATDGSTTMLHRLQAQVLRESWSEEEREQACESAVNLLGAVDIDKFRRSDTESRRRETLDLIEQLRTIGEQAYSHSLFEYDGVCSNLVKTMFAANNLGMSLELMTLKNALEVLKESIGPNHAVILIARSILAQSYQRSGHIEKAISMFEDLLETSRYSSEQGSTFTLELSNNLANAYREAGRNDEAILIYEELIEQTISNPTPDYRTSFTLHNNLASAYLNAERIDEAISMFEKTIVRCVNTFGESDTFTLSLCDNLAGAYELNGRLDDAICLHQMVLAARTDILSERHADTLTTANNLAYAYQSSGRLDDAIDLLTTTLANSKHSLGKDNPITCTIRNNLASAYRSAGRFSEAIPLLKQSIVYYINSFGPRANITHHLLELLADTFISEGEPSSAIPLFAHLTSEYSKLVGPEDVDALRSRNNLAFSYALSGDFPEAITQWQAILSDCQRCLGPSHSLTADVSNNLEAAIRILEQEENSATE